MPLKGDNKKVIETRVLNVARNLGIPVPLGEIPGEEPDFTFNTERGLLGIEVRELLRPASSNNGIVPAAEERFHGEVVQLAKKLYYETSDAVPATIRVYFADSRGKRSDKKQMARALADR